MKTKMDYKQAYKKLEKLVDKLAEGDIALEDLTGKVEKANKLLAVCENKLRRIKDDLVMISDDEE